MINSWNDLVLFLWLEMHNAWTWPWQIYFVIRCFKTDQKVLIWQWWPFWHSIIAVSKYTQFSWGYLKCLKGHLLCNIYFFTSLLHQHVSPLCKEIMKVSGKKIRSLFVLIHLYKNLSENELIRFWPLCDVTMFFWLVWPLANHQRR